MPPTGRQLPREQCRRRRRAQQQKQRLTPPLGSFSTSSLSTPPSTCSHVKHSSTSASVVAMPSYPLPRLPSAFLEVLFSFRRVVQFSSCSCNFLVSDIPDIFMVFFCYCRDVYSAIRNWRIAFSISEDISEFVALLCVHFTYTRCGCTCYVIIVLHVPPWRPHLLRNNGFSSNIFRLAHLPFQTLGSESMPSHVLRFFFVDPSVFILLLGAPSDERLFTTVLPRTLSYVAFSRFLVGFRQSLPSLKCSLPDYSSSLTVR